MCHWLRFTKGTDSLQRHGSAEDNIDLFELFAAHLQSLHSKTNFMASSWNQDLHWRIGEVNIDVPNRIIHGVALIIETGKEQSILKPEGIQTYYKPKSEGAAEPLCFTLLVDDDGYATVLLTERRGTKGIKSLLVNELSKVASSSTKWSLKCHGYLPEGYMMQCLEHAQIKEIRIVPTKPPRGMRALLGDAINRCSPLTIRLSAKRSSFLGIPIEDLRQFKESGHILFEEDSPVSEVYAFLEIGGKKRMWNVGSPYFSWPVLEEEVDSGANGYADPDAFGAVTVSLANTIADDIRNKAK